jgi:serine/threonine-protein kinase
MTTLERGDRLDHYRIDSLVAESGMAWIYKATDVQSGAVVAIKIPYMECESDPLFFSRFKREEAIGQKLDHPGVMKVYQDDDRSRVYMVMEWVEGQLLRQILAAGSKLSPERATRITLGICDALGYIHGQGVVHRDLKPENVMVDSEDRVKLIDFGIAGSLRERRLTYGRFTKAMGTPDYVSPEQIQSRRSDARSDLYALGVMFYEMLTGEMPFQGPNPIAVMNDRLLNNPIPPREVDPDISLQLQEIIYRALERDPAARYPSALEFARDLRNPQQVQIVERTALRDWKERRTGRPKRILAYVMLAMIPIAIFVLLLVVAKRG